MPGAATDNKVVEGKHSDKAVLITGAAGQIGRELCRQLQAAGVKILPTDLEPAVGMPLVPCNLTSQEQVGQLFHSQPIAAVVHLAGLLPSAFLADPLRGMEVNVTASSRLLREAITQGVERFVFASSMSVYGSAARNQPVREEDPLAPDDPYAACKCAVESAGETLSNKGDVEFVALRIARVVGPGAKNTSSLWRSQIFETSHAGQPISIPFTPDTLLSLVHVQEVARMLAALVKAGTILHAVYNAPAETWEARRLQAMIETTAGARVVLGSNGNAGPACDGSRFRSEFGFELRGLSEYLSAIRRD